MTNTRPAAAARAFGPQRRRSAATPSSRNRTHVSQERDGWRQMRARLPECRLRRAMIGAMHDPPADLLTGRSSDTFAYTSAYRPAYTVVYTKAEEVR